MIRLPQDVTQAIEQAETVVVPSRQRSEAVRLAYAATALAGARTVWHTPDVLPLDTWKAREIERRAASGESFPRLLTSAEEWLLWRQGATQLTEGLDLVARAPLAEALRRASHLAQEFGIDVSKLRGPPGSESALLFNVENAVAEKTWVLGASSPAHLAARLPCLGGERSLVLAGFSQVTPALAALNASRSDQGCLSRFRAPNPHTANRTRAVFASDTAEELERIADWCRTRLEAQPDARLLVLLPGAPEARERLITLIRQNIDPRRSVHGELASGDSGGLAAIEGGLPLSRAPLAAHALRALTWLTGGSEFADFSAWLCSPYWSLPFAARARLDLWLRERAPLEMDTRSLLSALEFATDSVGTIGREISKHIVAALRELGTGRASPRQWSERFDSALSKLKWPGERVLDSDEEQTRARFTELLDDFGQLAAVAGPISRETAVQWLNELAARTSFRPASGDALVTVSAQMMDPIVEYDGLWVAGLHADAWPQPVQPDPFLPLSAQIAAGIPQATSAGRAAEARALMLAWRACTPDLVLSSPLRAEDVQLSPSPMLAPYAARAHAPGISATGGHAQNSAPDPATFAAQVGRGESAPSLWLPLRVRREGLTEQIDDSAGPSWDVTRPLPSGTRSVELQNLCPFRAYAELRLGSVPLDAPEPGVAADLRGKLLHTALERLWGVLGGSEGLHSHTPESLGTLIDTCVDDAALATMGPINAEERPAAERRECRRAGRLIRSLCELERKRAPFVVRETEVDRTLQLSGAPVRLRIDRLDALGTGGLAILDYKSGRPITGDWYSERPSHPQLLAYLTAVGTEALAMATVTVAARDIRFDGVAAEINLLPRVRAVEGVAGEAGREAWELRRNEWHARIEQLAADFIAGRAPVDPRPKACEYCHVVSVCRIADVSASAVEQNISD